MKARVVSSLDDVIAALVEETDLIGELVPSTSRVDSDWDWEAPDPEQPTKYEDAIGYQRTSELVERSLELLPDLDADTSYDFRQMEVTGRLLFDLKAADTLESFDSRDWTRNREHVTYIAKMSCRITVTIEVDDFRHDDQREVTYHGAE